MEREYKEKTFTLTKDITGNKMCGGCAFEKNNHGCMNIGDACMTDAFQGKCWEEKQTKKIKEDEKV